MKLKLSILLLILVIACKSEHNNTSEDTTQSIMTLEGETQQQLEFNNGKKWIANIETHIRMKHIDSILGSYKFEESKDGIILANTLSKETNLIIKSCNMTGKAHDQLHIVLLPILEEISAIKEKQNTKEMNTSVDKLKTLTSKYFKYFTSN